MCYPEQRQQKSDLGKESSHIYRCSASLRKACLRIRWLHWQTTEQAWIEGHISGWFEYISISRLYNSHCCRTFWKNKCWEKLTIVTWPNIVEWTRTGILWTTSARFALSTTPGSRRWRPSMRIIFTWAGGRNQHKCGFVRNMRHQEAGT